MKKRFLAAVLLLIMSFSLAVSASAMLLEQSDEFYVADYAGVLSKTTKDKIVSSNADDNGLSALCDGAEIVVVTIKYLDGMYSDEYAMQVFNDWGIGNGSANNGMLLLLVTEEKKGWLEVGAGIRSYWSEDTIDDYLDMYFWDYVDAGQYDTAVSSILDPLFSWYADFYGISQNEATPKQDIPIHTPMPEAPQYTQRPIRSAFSIISSFIFSTWFWIFVIVIFIMAINIRSDRVRYRTYYRHMGVPVPRYHFWYAWGAPRPHRTWYNNNHRGPRGPGGPGGRPPGGGSGRPPSSGGGRPPSGGGRSGGGAGRGGSSGSKSSGGFGGFGGSSGGRSSGGFGGFGGSSGGRSSGGGFSGGGGRSGGGGGGRSGGGGGRR